MEDTHTILIVDDLPENIDMLAQALPEYRKKVATTAKQVFEIVLSANKPDLILLDIMLPDMDGYELCRELKEDKKTEHIPIIFITALSDVKDEVKGLDLGAADYIIKPFNPAVVRSRVNTQIQLLKAQNQLIKQNEELKEIARLREDVERISRHDLKNPLSVVMTYTHILLEDEDLAPEYKNELKKIDRALHQALHMVNSTLDILKMERCYYELNPEKVCLKDVFEQIEEDLYSLLRIKQLTLQYKHGARNNFQEATVFGEELLLYTLFANLLKNAGEASQNEKTIYLEYTEQEDNKACISIINHGTVPKEIRDRFFKKYVTAQKKRGTGLGAYSARLIAVTHNGDIEMETIDDTYTKINIYLPIS